MERWLVAVELVGPVVGDVVGLVGLVAHLPLIQTAQNGLSALSGGHHLLHCCPVPLHGRSSMVILVGCDLPPVVVGFLGYVGHPDYLVCPPVGPGHGGRLQR